jgi:acetolactate decarboxylase
LKDTLFQHSTIGALMGGMFDGTLALNEVLTTNRTMGIGTLDGLDGELIIVDGTPFQVKVDGTVHEVDKRTKTPYVAVTNFEKEGEVTVTETLSSNQFKEKLKQAFSSVNTFQAVKVKGTFQKMHCRSVEKQEKPYPRLVDAAKDQVEFTRETVEGVLLGFYTPEIFGSIAVPEFHLHFLSDEHDFGGHVLDFTLEKGRGEWQTMETLEQHFPIKNNDFMEATIDYENLAEDIEEAE